ncbi:uncharacterized protein Z520_07933 [Fonsecaea multimorphosa CBS 102226]|uniref:Uncharacterized protein n=1 Tax=Fonsecaea multimorphosa CBS 102226 TaxID=1442371 RepID=A0A0D2H2Q8_9EURO|nr:uncharacterized protein Z520_07933 [Fonsecaea multimorphosa CBS 102226]KIX96155.1 hypothetical protein Z520_07933 [Fonsecaea multimorphosa CBS 102226]OAL22263.1 hypothetical protein AYO22_07307 [Fonsecaea multimorphosa]
MSTSTVPAPLAGKVALVTGGSRGIGRGIAIHFATKGISKITITHAGNSSAAEETLAAIGKINPNITATAIQADVLSPSFASDLVPRVLRDLSTQTIDIIVCNAAYVNPTIVAPIATATKELFDNLMTGNAWAPVQLFLTALPYIPRGGRVVMIGSTASKAPNADPAVCYGASKAALDSFTRSLALIFSAKHGITVNSVSVGPVMTDLLRVPLQQGMLPDGYIPALVSKNTAEKRMGEVDDIAGIVAFLASEESRWINGNNVPANGGALLEIQG